MPQSCVNERPNQQRSGRLDEPRLPEGSMRVLISARWLGGVGGMERSLASIVRALHRDEIDVAATTVIPSVYLPDAGNMRVLPRWRFLDKSKRPALFWWPAVVPLVRRFDSRYDVYIQYRNGPYLGDRFDCGVKCLILGGKPSPKLEAEFDFVLVEAPGGTEIVSDPSKARLVAPPTFPGAVASEPVEHVPEKFFLTVFNPHGEIKGHDLLYEVAESSRYPIVWCHSNATGDLSSEIREHANVIHVDDPTQAQIRWLYERCQSYVSFSRYEGYGWSLADALIYGAPVISRRIGVLTFYEEEPGLYFYESVSELHQMLEQGGPFEGSAVDTTRLAPETFAKQLRSLVMTGGIPDG